AGGGSDRTEASIAAASTSGAAWAPPPIAVPGREMSKQRGPCSTSQTCGQARRSNIRAEPGRRRDVMRGDRPHAGDARLWRRPEAPQQVEPDQARKRPRQPFENEIRQRLEEGGGTVRHGRPRSHVHTVI